MNGPRDYVLLEVMDTGVGISASDLEKIFDPDFTTSACGSGLGLAIVKKIVNDHGGEIHVESTPGAGSVFGVYLPIQ